MLINWNKEEINLSNGIIKIKTFNLFKSNESCPCLKKVVWEYKFGEGCWRAWILYSICNKYKYSAFIYQKWGS